MSDWERDFWDSFDENPDRAWEVLYEFIEDLFSNARWRLIRDIPEHERMDVAHDLMARWVRNDLLGRVRRLSRESGRLGGFLGLAIRRFILGYFRARSRRSSRDESVRNREDQRLKERGQPADAPLLDEEAMALYRAALERISQRCRILLRLLERLGSNIEIARHPLARSTFGNDLTNMRVGQMLYRCRAQLRRALGDDGLEDLLGA